MKLIKETKRYKVFKLNDNHFELHLKDSPSETFFDEEKLAIRLHEIEFGKIKNHKIYREPRRLIYGKNWTDNFRTQETRINWKEYLKSMP